MNMLTLLIAVCFLSEAIQAQSRLDLNEINTFKYRFEIATDLARESAEIGEETLVLKNVHGQKYECGLPRLEELAAEESYHDTGKKTAYNFTLIGEKVNRSTSLLSRSKMCVYRVSRNRLDAR
jgi:hypothetical protein